MNYSIGKFNLNPFGEGEVTEILHQGQIFNIYKAKLLGQDVVLKTPSPRLNEQNLYTSGFHGMDTSLYIGRTRKGLIEEDNSFNVPKPNFLSIVTSILLHEYQFINLTKGAWNHEIIALGNWDFLSNCHQKNYNYSDRFSETLELRFMPVLIMPYYQASALSNLPIQTKKQLFPKLLPALWDALSIMSHGDLSESNILINFEKNIFHPGYVNCVAFSPDGQIASASNDQTIKIWQL